MPKASPWWTPDVHADRRPRLMARNRVAAALRFWKIAPEEALLAHDELDLAPGAARLKFDGGHGGQNGLRDIFKHIGHGKFARLRVGIGHPGHKDRVTGWVLPVPMPMTTC